MFVYGIAVAIFFWLLILSWIVWQLRDYVKNNQVYGDKDLKLHNEVDLIKKELKQEIAQSKYYLQKIGLTRFNPFERGGNDQSFVVALLDQENNGLTANFIYTRDGLRVYTKKVKAGKGELYELSDEEKKAIDNCLKK